MQDLQGLVTIVPDALQDGQSETIIVYLNDDFVGGETEFPVLGDKVKPKKGKLLVFPPMWNYLHRGNPPLKPGYAKYFLMTYLNYTDMQK